MRRPSRPNCGEQFRDFPEAQIAVFGAPPVDGLGSTGGFKLQVQDRRGAGLRALQGAVQNLADADATQTRDWSGCSAASASTQPQLFVEIDREKVKAQKVSLDDVHTTLQAYLGAAYVNDFSFQNRNWQVNVQADPRYRMRVEDIGKLEVRNADGQRRALRTLINIKDTSGPAIVNHYNLYPSAELNGNTAPGASSGQAIAIMESLGKRALPVDHGLRVDGAHAPADPRRPGPLHQAGLPAGRGLRVPGAVGAVRKLVAAAVDHSDRADVPAGRASRASGWRSSTTTSSPRSAWSC